MTGSKDANGISHFVIKTNKATVVVRILLPVMLSSLHDQCPLVIVVVHSWCFQTDSAFMYQRWMQRVQYWYTLGNRFIYFLLFVLFASFLPQSKNNLPMSLPDC